MDFSILQPSDIIFVDMNYHSEKRRRVTLLHFEIQFQVKEETFFFHLNVGKKGKWSGSGFTHMDPFDGYSCKYCAPSYRLSCNGFEKHQKKLVKTLLQHEDVLNEFRKIRTKILLDHNINLFKTLS